MIPGISIRNSKKSAREKRTKVTENGCGYIHCSASMQRSVASNWDHVLQQGNVNLSAL